jgi:hypothetical protein
VEYRRVPSGAGLRIARDRLDGRDVGGLLFRNGRRAGAEYGHFETGGSEGLRQELEQLLADDIEQDTEVYLLIGPDERKIVGNIAGWATKTAPLDRLTDRAVTRNGHPSISRVLPRLLPDGSILVVGRDTQDQREIEQLVWRALLAGGAGGAAARGWRCSVVSPAD